MRMPVAAGILGVLAGGIILFPGGASPARADDIDTIASEIVAARRKLNELNLSTEAAAEAFNAGRLRLGAAQQSLSTATAEVRRADATVRSAREKRRALGSAAYRSGGLEQLAVLLSGDPGTALGRVGAMDALARRGREAENRFRAARHDRDAARTAAEVALAEQRRQVASLDEDKRRVEASVEAQQSVLGELVARHTELVRRAREREAAARRAREEADAAAAAAAARNAAAEAEALRNLNQRTTVARRGFAETPITPSRSPALGSGGARVAVAEAHAQLGKPYVWGAAGPNAFDCSGLTQWVWAKAGVALSHYTGAQWNEGRRVSRDELIPGDLVFFGADLSHMGIYIGGEKMIHAPRAGTVVRISPVWRENYAGAVRPGA